MLAGVCSPALRFRVFAGALDLSPVAGENVMAAILGFVGFVGFGVMVIAAFLGGDLVFGAATGAITPTSSQSSSSSSVWRR